MIEYGSEDHKTWWAEKDVDWWLGLEPRQRKTLAILIEIAMATPVGLALVYIVLVKLLVFTRLLPERLESKWEERNPFGYLVGAVIFIGTASGKWWYGRGLKFRRLVMWGVIAAAGGALASYMRSHYDLPHEDGSKHVSIAVFGGMVFLYSLRKAFWTALGTQKELIPVFECGALSLFLAVAIVATIFDADRVMRDGRVIAEYGLLLSLVAFGFSAWEYEKTLTAAAKEGKTKISVVRVLFDVGDVIGQGGLSLIKATAYAVVASYAFRFAADSVSILGDLARWLGWGCAAMATWHFVPTVWRLIKYAFGHVENRRALALLDAAKAQGDAGLNTEEETLKGAGTGGVRLSSVHDETF